ncbi:hypothetical protein Tco_0787744 [Tanacetum coccineum]
MRPIFRCDPIWGCYKKYTSVAQFKECLTYYALANGFFLWHERSGEVRVVAKCEQRPPRVSDPKKGKQRKQTKYPVLVVMTHLNVLGDVMLDAKKYALTEYEKSIGEHYSMLRSYGKAVLDSNPGSIVKLGVTLNPDGKNYVDRSGSEGFTVDEAWFETYMNFVAYHNYVKPVPGTNLWHGQSMYSTVLPPKPRKMPGRPRKKRIRDIGEGGSSTRVSKVGLQGSCSNCKKPGHNKSSCKEPIVEQTPKPKRVVGMPKKKQPVDDFKDVDVVQRGPVRNEGASGTRGGAIGSRGRGGRGAGGFGGANGSIGKGACGSSGASGSRGRGCYLGSREW